MAVRISWNWCRASGGVSSRYEARHHRADRPDLEGRTRGRGHRDPARSVWGVVIGAGVEGRARRKRGWRPRPGDAGIYHSPVPGPGIQGTGDWGVAAPNRPAAPRDQVADGGDLLPVAGA